MTDFNAINSTTISGRQFKVFAAEDASVGNPNTDDADFKQIDVEGITLPTFSPNQEFEMRSGTGRVAEFAQMFSSSKGVVTEFTLTGRLDQINCAMFAENVTGNQAGEGASNLGVVDINTGYSGGTNMKDGDSISSGDYHQTLTFYFQAPTASDSYTLFGCVCTNFQITGDMGTASGRFDYSATFRTQYKPSKAAVDMVAGTFTAIPSTQMFLSDMSTKFLNMINVGGSSFYRNFPVFNSISLTFDAPAVFMGASGSDAEPEVIGRALPEMNITFGASLKYDDETDNLLEAHRDANQNSYIQLAMATHTLTGTAPTGSAVFNNDLYFADSDAHGLGIIFHQAKLINASVGSGDIATVDIEAKIVDQGTNYILRLATGDTSAS
tara:strand:- start:241 stop:1386 length:1146 start_codon:yes stop_codon:yes gene_type:complete